MNTFFTIANIITLMRIGLVPVMLSLIVHQCWNLAVGCFVLIMITDWADGFFARLLHQQTAIGAVLDHAADKLLMLVFFTFALITNALQLPAWFCWFILSKECVLLIGAALLLCGRYMPTIAPLLLGKVTMALQMGLILWWLCAQSGLIAFAAWPVLILAALNGLLVALYAIEYVGYVWKRA